jgi:hypothetical protein
MTAPILILILQVATGAALFVAAPAACFTLRAKFRAGSVD